MTFPTLRRVLLPASFVLATLLTPNLAHADALRADLDGDGIRDRIEFGNSSQELTIGLSRTHRSQRLHTSDPIVKFVVTDIDHDGDPDLVASTRHSGLHIWINKGRGLFCVRLPHDESRPPQLARRRPSPGVHGVSTWHLDDVTLNDSHPIIWSVPARAQHVLVGDTLTAVGAARINFTHRQRTPRGPPILLVS